MFKRYPFLSLAMCALCVMSPFANSSLEAAGWGKGKVQETVENIIWNKVFFDGEGIKLAAFVPGYSGAQFSEGEVSLYGAIVAEGTTIGADYAIITTYESGFERPQDLNAFLKMVKKANKDHKCAGVVVKSLEKALVVDLTPHKKAETIYWRFVGTQDRLIKMGTNDTDADRRQKFFNSLTLKSR